MISRIYEYLHEHRSLRWTSLLCLTALLAALVMRLTYKEDISDFLPLGTEDREALDIYQDISGANRLFVIFENTEGEDTTTHEIDAFCHNVKKADKAGWTKSMTAQFDMEKVEEVQQFVYQNIPYFLTDADYRRMDSVLAEPDVLNQRLQADQEMLMFPSGSLLSANISHDPLNLFTPVVAKLQRHQMQSRFEMYDGYIFSPDRKKAIVMLSSPFGNAETEQNTKLITLLDNAIEQMQEQYPKAQAHVVGGPQIAVGNAAQIKQDSILAIALSGILILGLLFYSFRSIKNILLIAFSIGWGWLFALGGMALLHDSVSIIVIGISSVILGIAVNYPLHLVAHTGHCGDVRSAMKDIAAPLLVGNITTVGAFLALVPLQSTALHDLGIFASLLLIGTIAFVLIYMPHHVKVSKEKREIKVLRRISEVQLENKPWVIWSVVVLTLIFGWFSLQTEFDSNMANINYMTPQQHEDMDYFQHILAADSSSTTQTLYIVSSGKSMDEALDKALARQTQIEGLEKTHECTGHNGVSQFLVSEKEQQHRLALWQQFVEKHRTQLTTGLSQAALANDFTPEAFSDFTDILNADYAPKPFAFFAPLTQLVFSGNISIDREDGRFSIIDKVQVEETKMPEMLQRVRGSFDVKSMNSALADTLTDDFNYIGWACSAIVFFFLWFSFGRIELAIVSFLPMAISWVWILGIMAMLGIKFNIVNVILATFIFGQGDDYTIFMTEGCLYEHIHNKPMLASYKYSILLSALIMFFGIGTLIVARHPALFSLAEVTLIGMCSVVLMAWLVPPLCFRWLVKLGRFKD